jgi:hypothetical protein
MLKVRAYLVNGGVQDMAAEDDFVEKYRQLVNAGVSGRELVHELFTDDWGPPPQNIKVSGTTAKGEKIEIFLDYPRQRSSKNR